MSTACPRPRVSVIMANYNGAAHIAEAVRSVLGQTLRAIELVLSDDGSTDASLARAREAAGSDDRLHIVEGPPRSGPAAARNRALRLARGAWIAIVDSDDFIHAERFERLLAAAEREGADIVADDLRVFYEDGGARPHGLLTGSRAAGPTWVSALDYIRENTASAGTSTLGYLKPIIRRSIVDDVAYDETLRIAEDFDLVARLLLAGAKMRIEPEQLYSYRKHSASISHRLSVRDLDAMIAAGERLGRLEGADDRVRGALRGRGRSLESARAFAALVDAIKARDWRVAGRIALTRPSTVWRLREAALNRLGGGASFRPAPQQNT